VWRERNTTCFEDKANTVKQIKFNCILLSSYWSKVEFVNDAESILSFLKSLLDKTGIQISVFAQPAITLHFFNAVFVIQLTSSKKNYITTL